MVIPCPRCAAKPTRERKCPPECPAEKPHSHHTCPDCGLEFGASFGAVQVVTEGPGV